METEIIEPSIIQRPKQDPSITYLEHPGLAYQLGRILMSAFAFIFFNSYVRLRIKGKQHLPASPFIICSNHQSHLDGPILSYLSNRDFRRTGMIAAKDYWFDYKPRYRIASHFFNLIPIARNGEADYFTIHQTLDRVKKFLSDNRNSVMILPEGSRSKSDQIKPFKKGVVFLSEALNIPIVPVYLHNTHKRWPKGKVLIRPGIVRVKIGNPIYPNELNSENNAEIVRKKILELKNDVG